KDESGDFTKGAGLSEAGASEVLAFISASGETRTQTLARLSQQLGAESPGVAELQGIDVALSALGVGDDRAAFDTSIVRGLEYYTGAVFEAQLLTKSGKSLGSVGGGGRYDDLVARFRGERVPATGFSIGVSRLQAALAALASIRETPAACPVVVTVCVRDRIADYQRMVAALRSANIRAELYLGNPKNNIGAQLKYADKRGAPCAVIQGGDEKARGEVQIKDLILGATLAATKDRDEYLKKQAEA